MNHPNNDIIKKRKTSLLIRRRRTPKLLQTLTLPSISSHPPQSHAKRNIATVITAFLSVSSLSLVSAVYAVPLKPIDTTPTTPREYQNLITSSTVNQPIPLERSQAIYVLSADVSTYKNLAPDFVNDETRKVQFPFRTGVPISSHFGIRPQVCEAAGCEATENHTGTDFTPGEGADIQAIADGVVIEVVNFNGNTVSQQPPPSPDGKTTMSLNNAAGTYVKILHNIDGEQVISWYAHMQQGSVQVSVGEQVQVGYIVGKVGNTGLSLGAHLHLEINVNGKTIDPIPYLTAKNASSAQFPH